MIDRLTKQECCGCNACGDICPKGAISFTADQEGFLNPVIDHNKCINCGLCDKVCPSINVDKLKRNDFELPKCFAAVNKNLEIRFDSTSGGVFSALAKKAYRHKYYVAGAVWNDDWTVSQVISNVRHDLEKLRSSKYIQSDTRGLYKKIKQLLIQGEYVLICGTPCQIAALKSYLGENYENLITIDFICQYVNSPYIWQKYIEFVEKEHNSKVIYIKDKNKELGWRKLCNKIVFENGDVRYDIATENYFRKCYMELGVASRPSCYECKFKGFPRIADITIADFWGVEKYCPKELDNNLGTSLVLCNSQKGLDYFDDEVKRGLVIVETDLNNTLQGNKALTVPYVPPFKIERDKFYKDLLSSDLKTVVDSYLNKYKPQKNVWKSRIKTLIRFIRTSFRVSNGDIINVFKSIKLNFFNKHILADPLNGDYIVLYPNCKFSFNPGSRIRIKGILTLGYTSNKTNKRISYFELRKNSLFDVQGTYTFSSGADVQIFENATFTIEGGGDTNINVEIVCGKSICFQKHVYLGRNVIIRDTNGEHFISRQGYKTTRPVIVGTHAWVCDRATIMPGVHVYPGGIIGASSYVISDVNAFTMVSGNPARVVDEEVYWKD